MVISVFVTFDPPFRLICLRYDLKVVSFIFCAVEWPVVRSRRHTGTFANI